MFQSGQPPPISVESRTRIVPNTAFLFLFLWIILAIFLKEKAKNRHFSRISSTEISVPSSIAVMQMDESNGVVTPPE